MNWNPRSEETGFEKYTETELLKECRNCVSDLYNALLREDCDDRPKVETLLDELERRFGE